MAVSIAVSEHAVALSCRKASAEISAEIGREGRIVAKCGQTHAKIDAMINAML